MPRAAQIRSVLLALLLLPALVGCSSLTGTNEGGYIPGDGGVIEIADEDREPPVELTGETVDGGEYALDRGTVTVVNVWWSGCGPCIREMPMLTELYAAYDGAVDFLGINIKDSTPENARLFEERLDVEYPSIYAPGGDALLAFTGRTSPRAMPTTLVLDADGVVVSIISGEIPSRTTLTDLVEDAGGPPAPDPGSTDESTAGAVDGPLDGGSGGPEYG